RPYRMDGLSLPTVGGAALARRGLGVGPVVARITRLPLARGIEPRADREPDREPEGDSDREVVESDAEGGAHPYADGEERTGHGARLGHLRVVVRRRRGHESKLCGSRLDRLPRAAESP